MPVGQNLTTDFYKKIEMFQLFGMFQTRPP
jgi:hypothetical protein